MYMIFQKLKDSRFNSWNDIAIAYQSSGLEESVQVFMDDLNTTNDYFYKLWLKPNYTKTYFISSGFQDRGGFIILVNIWIILILRKFRPLIIPPNCIYILEKN